jgi:hypothetical protein
MAIRDGSESVAPQLRRTLAITVGLAATALAVSFAWAFVGGVLHPDSALAATAPAVSPVATSCGPLTAPPLRPPRHGAPRRFSATYAAVTTQTPPARTRSARAHAIAAGESPEGVIAGPTGLACGHSSSLLHTESKSSRTRGQPGPG